MTRKGCVIKALSDMFCDIETLDRHRCLLRKREKYSSIVKATFNVDEIRYEGEKTHNIKMHPRLAVINGLAARKYQFMFGIHSLYSISEMELPHRGYLPDIYDFNFGMAALDHSWSHYYACGELCLGTNVVSLFYGRHSFSFDDDPVDIVSAYLKEVLVPYIFNFEFYLCTGLLIEPERDNHVYRDCSRCRNYI